LLYAPIALLTIKKTYLEHMMNTRFFLLSQLLCTCLIALSSPSYAAHSDKNTVLAPQAIELPHHSTMTTSNNGDSVISNLLMTPKLDGLLDEWQALQDFHPSKHDNNAKLHHNNRLEWRETWVANDNENIYIAYSNKGKIPKNDWWAWEVYLDTDHNPKTGYTEFNQLGAEYLLQGNELYQYVGNGNSQDDWEKKWKYVGYANGQIDAVTSTDVELSIPIKWLNIPAQAASEIHLVFYGDNEAFGGEGEDIHRTQAGYFRYQVQLAEQKT
jgi:hypothetical protein